MATSKNTGLLGIRSLSDCNKIVVYNSCITSDKSMLGRMGMEDYYDTLSQSITTVNVDDIYNVLSEVDEFSPILKSETSTGNLIYFNFDNNRSNVLSGAGFDTIIFAQDDLVIGYTQLNNIVSKDVVTNTTTYSLKRTYKIKYVSIIINTVDSTVRVDEDSINLVSNIKLIAEKETRDFSGKNNYNYLTKANLGEINEITENNFNIYINPILKRSSATDVFTDISYSNIDSSSKPSGYSPRLSPSVKYSRLNLIKDFNLPTDYTNYDHIQFGFFGKDPALYLWNDNNSYSIFSLSSFLVSPNLLPYTTARLGNNGVAISKTNIYNLPFLYSGAVQKILYFAGHYVVAMVDNKRYVFDITAQDGEIGLSEPLYNKNNGWIVKSYSSVNDYYLYDGSKWISTTEADVATVVDELPETSETGTIVMMSRRVPSHLTNFIIDRLDIRCRISPLNSLTWDTYKNAINDYYNLSNVYMDSKFSLTNGAILVGRIGDWFMFEEEKTSAVIYSNMTKSIKLSSKENNPIIINNEVLLTWVTSGDGFSTTYTIYDEPGYYATPTYYNLKYNSATGSLTDGDSRYNNYIVYRTSTSPDKILTIKTKSDESSKSSSPILIQRSFLRQFRRNVLPDTLENFKIIGSLCGIIYYRIGNVINYL